MGVVTEENANLGFGSNMDSRQEAMGWKNWQGPSQQGSLNHAGCLHFILLQKAIGSFQQSHGLMGYTILKNLKKREREREWTVRGTWSEGWGGKIGRLTCSSKELLMSWTRVAAISR